MVDPVRTEVEDGVLVVTLDRPRANAIDVATSHALHDAFARLENDPDLRVGVLTGAGDRFFSAGWDLKAAAAGEAVDADHGPGGFAGLTELFGRTKPVIAAVNGLAVGGGLELALAADLMVVADHAELALTEVRVGVVADAGGLLRLPRRLPEAVARELLLTGRRMTAEEAGRWGLANQVVPGPDLMGTALDAGRRDPGRGTAGGCGHPGGAGRHGRPRHPGRVRPAALGRPAVVHPDAGLGGRGRGTPRLHREAHTALARPLSRAAQENTPTSPTAASDSPARTTRTPPSSSTPPTSWIALGS